MPLPIGTWTAVVNGFETPLRIDPLDQQGIFTGQIFSGRIKGFWNESAQKIQFASFTEVGQGGENPLFGIFEGYLFRVPFSVEPGSDVTATLVGSLAASAQLVGSNVLPGVVPTARRQTFGWLAKLIEAQ
jgi:hypothetical protein